MSRKSKRGFKKLHDHELAELASIQPGSDSEIELELRGDMGETDHSPGGCGYVCRLTKNVLVSQLLKGYQGSSRRFAG